MMRSGGRWGRLEIHADTGRKIWGTHVAVLGVERGGGGGGGAVQNKYSSS